ncbi:hypothetical protein [Brevifollis gellanilyticus]|uniref:Uncharacterized protein n=1 Tax=Brevifollis gellanilyticus TaxID=748831 RepID=A0A512M3B4_9BACT|nr:hypothetical protein [Brevifollis gellanilyticus]GEP41235.1 hypothetical protein BGE01nite_05260 [Brevifollis gellanilyticus]
MSYEIIFSPSAANADDSGASFFAEPYRDFCQYLAKCAADCGNKPLEEEAKWAAKHQYLTINGTDADQLTLIRNAAHTMLNDPDLAPWERMIRGLYAQYDRPLDDHSAIVRKSTDDGLTLLIRKMDEMIAAKTG